MILQGFSGIVASMTQQQDITVIGAGAWGTALAQNFCATGHNVRLYVRDDGLARAMEQTRENSKYLPGITLDARLSPMGHLESAVKNAQIIVLAVPTQHLRRAMGGLTGLLPPDVPLINTAKGIEIASGDMPSAIIRHVAPRNPFAVLSGPTFAHEVARGLPAAITLASTAPAAQLKEWAQTLSAPAFRVYTSQDVAGVEIAGALKNVIAIACGIVAGKKLGENARAAVMTRGMAEIKRLGVSLGAQADTFLGLSGIGDLTLTCSSTASRNFSLGFALGEGMTAEEYLSTRASVAEGHATAKAVAALALEKGVDMPICTGVAAILHNGARVGEVMTGLLSRSVKEETL